MTTLYPVGYGRELAPMTVLDDRYLSRAHPEFAMRLRHYLESHGGLFGIGSLWRRTPHPCSAASRAGHSFHQDQRFRSGFVGASAADLVCVNGRRPHRSPRHDEVPWQGTHHLDTARFGLHVNIRNEPWHYQCVEIDGYRTWRNAGRPDPASMQPVTPSPPIRDEVDDVALINLVKQRGGRFVFSQWSDGTTKWVPDPETLDVVRGLSGLEVEEMPNDAFMRACGPIVGPRPPGVDAWGVAE